MNKNNKGRPWKIMLVEDNPGDIILVEEALSGSGIEFELNSVTTGTAAVDFLKMESERGSDGLPDLILLDLNLPRMNGKDVLRTIKSDDKLGAIPVVILTSSEAEGDIYTCYKLKANSYVAKPVDFDHFIEIINYIKVYWLSVVKLPPHNFQAGV